MALSATNDQLRVSVTSATQSNHIKLPPGEYCLECTSAGAFALDIQVAADPAQTFRDLYDTNGKVTFDTTAAAKMHVIVAGGLCYRMDVDTYNSEITLAAYSVKVSN